MSIRIKYGLRLGHKKKKERENERRRILDLHLEKIGRLE